MGEFTEFERSTGMQGTSAHSHAEILDITSICEKSVIVGEGAEATRLRFI